tara:strand:+ start:527 stop:742 length:216 start_codon:yes stop_codon:yes gene_type:complete
MVSKSLLLLASLSFAFSHGRVDNKYLYIEIELPIKSNNIKIAGIRYTNTLKFKKLFGMAYLLGELHGSSTE